MLSRSARLAAVLTIAQTAILLALPSGANAVAAEALAECGDQGGHYCCVDAPECPDVHRFCCWFEGAELGSCGCASPAEQQ